MSISRLLSTNVLTFCFYCFYYYYYCCVC